MRASPVYAVVTRELAEDSPYVTVLAAHGLSVVALPVTRTESVPHAFTNDHAYVVVASAKAANAYRGEVWAVGLATAAALAQHGVIANCPPGVTDGASLAEALVHQRDVRGERILVPRAEDGRLDIVTMLRDAGAIVDDVITYRTRATAADDPSLAPGLSLLRDHAAAVTIVFAPSQVRALVSLVGTLPSVRTRFLAIGETTASALREAGIADPLVAATPTPAGIASALAPVYPQAS